MHRLRSGAWGLIIGWPSQLDLCPGDRDLCGDGASEARVEKA